MKVLTHGDLFSGIGGFTLAAEAMGWRTRYFAEINPFACKILNQHFPGIPNLGDLMKIWWSRHEHAVNVLTAGFPCQPVSNAGRRLAESDPRWLWPYVATALRFLRPDYFVLENVPGILVRGMGSVLGDVQALGYALEWSIVSAAQVGAPHRRNRVWFIGCPIEDAAALGDQEGWCPLAYADGDGPPQDAGEVDGEG